MIRNLVRAVSSGIVAAVLSGATVCHAESVPTKGAEIGKWTQDYDAAVKLAAEKKLPMLLNFTGSDWCGWCKLMDKQVFAQPEWQDYAAKSVVLVTLDFPNDKSIVPAEFVTRNEKLSETFGVQGYPTYVVLDSDGKTQIGQLGASKEATPKDFIDQVKNALKMSEGAIEAKAAQLGAEKGKAYKDSIASYRAATKELRDWISTRPERNEENNKKFESFKAAIMAAKEKMSSF